MKRILAAVVICALSLVVARTSAHASEVDVLISKLVEKKVLTPSEGAIILDETKLQVSKDLAHQQSLSVPDWTQRIKWGGDIRYRTQYDSGKSNTNTLGGANNGIQEQRYRQRVRGRFYLEA